MVGTGLTEPSQALLEAMQEAKGIEPFDMAKTPREFHDRGLIISQMENPNKPYQVCSSASKSIISDFTQSYPILLTLN